MNCPACQRKFSFLYSFRILNPWNHRCPGCAARLTGGRRAAAAVAAGFGAGTLIGAATIGMAALRLWTLKQGVTYCAIALPAGILLTQYWAWKWMRFRVIATAD